MRLAGTGIAILMLAACGGQSGGNEANGNAAGGNAAGGTEAPGGGGGGAASAALQPGMWETTVEVVRMSAPNMPAGVTPPTPPPTTVSYCLTAAQAAQPNANFLTGSGEAGGCTSENLSMANGRIQGVVSCNAQGASMRSTMDGQFTPTSYDMTTQVQTTSAGMTMDMETRTRARRTGDCPGS
jgi:hypothetical protein